MSTTAVNVVTVVGPFPPFKGGISQHTARLAEGFERQQAEVRRYSWKSQYPHRLYNRAQRDNDTGATPDVTWSLSWWNPISWLRCGLSSRSSDVLITSYVSPFHASSGVLVLPMITQPD